ncbi:MAG: hypothetical protein BMS9Abin06_0830 [Gammaproteobacteria bacterium]|nr:MAG: hypothetical protein BMS9Abin06_0830 [Gammaproteobacteria bacterium]
MPDVDFHACIHYIDSFIWQLPGYCFIDVGFSTVLTYVRRHIFEYQCYVIPLQGASVNTP